MYKIPISGGPHTGKSTLMRELPREYPDAHFVPEPAEYIIKVEKAHAQADPDYEPMLPLTHFAAFSRVHEFLRRAYDKSGLCVVELPSFREDDKQTGVQKRLEIIRQRILQLDIAA